MATTERPKSRLDDGRVNPEYTAWRKQLKEEALKVIRANSPANTDYPHCPPLVVETDEWTETFPPESRIDTSTASGCILGNERSDGPSDDGSSVVGARDESPEEAREEAEAVEDFQSAAEPEQTTNDDPREPEVAPALEALKGGEVIEITVDRIARNKSFVYGGLNGELVPIRVKKKTGPKLVGKPINVTVTVEAGHTLFTHTP